MGRVRWFRFAIEALILIVAILAIVVVVADLREQMPYQVRVSTCGEASTDAITSEHATIDDAFSHADAALGVDGEIVQIHVWDGEFYALLWIRSESEDCYPGLFHEWTRKSAGR